MTFSADRDNIKPMFFSIAFVVMVVMSLISTSTTQGFNTRQNTVSNGCKYLVACFCPFWVILFVVFSCSLSFLALSVPFLKSFIFLCFAVTTHSFAMNLFASFRFSVFLTPLSITYFTLVVVAITISRGFVKLKDWFILLASTAGFCYGCLRHGFLLTRKSCLGPVTAHTVVGSCYYSQ